MVTIADNVYEVVYMKLAFINATLLDGTPDMTPVSGVTVLVNGDRIERIVTPEIPVESTGSAGTPDSADLASSADSASLVGLTSLSDLNDYEIINLNGSYLMPGLINLHAHLAPSGKPPKERSKPVNYKQLFKIITSNPLAKKLAKEMVASYAKTELYSGVTTLRTAGGVLDFDSQVRDEIFAGKRKGPRLITANTAISVPGGHFAGSIATEASSQDEAREQVRALAASGAQWVKLMVTGGVMDADTEGEPGTLRMPPEIVRAACDEAHKLGLRVEAHAESTAGVRVALENGVDTVEHGATLDDDLVRLFHETGAVYVSTISPALPYALFELEESHALPEAKVNGKIVMDGMIACAKRCIAEGIPVGVGNDVGCPFVAHYDFWRELCYLHKFVGVSNSDALHAATLGNARIAGIDHFTGSLEAGKFADMIVTDENPLENLAALRNVHMVVMQGRLIRDPKIKRFAATDALLDRYL